MGSRVDKRSGKKGTRRIGAIAAMLAAVLLLVAFAGIASAETADSGAADQKAQAASEKVDITVKAVWADEGDQAKARPSSVTAQLLADGKIVKDEKGKPVVITLSASKDWKTTVKDMDRTKDGKAIKYTVAAQDVDKYKSAAKESGSKDKTLSFEITFTYDAPAAADDAADKAKADDEGADEAKPAPAAADDDDAAPAEDDKDAAPAEDGDDAPAPADDKDAAVDDDADSKKADDADDGAAAPMADHGIPVAKIWDDGDDADGLRPESIELSLVKDDAVVATTTLTAGDGWEGVFAYEPDTQPAEYAVTEEAPDGYTYEVTGGIGSGFEVTNTHEVEYITVDVTKVWDDSDDADGLRPDTVSFALMAEGKEIVTAEMGADDVWSGTFETDADGNRLPKYKDGKEIEYSIEETSVPSGYTAEVTGDAESGFTITNTHKVEKKDDGKKEDSGKKDDAKKDKAAKDTPIPTCTVTATKVWKDKDNIKKTRVNVTLHLQQKVGDGKWTTMAGNDRAIAANAAGDGLKVTWTDLPTMDKQGNKIEYRVTEAWTKNYTSKVTGDVQSGFTVTNTLGGVPKTGDSNGGAGAGVVVILLGAAGAFVALRRLRRE